MKIRWNTFKHNEENQDTGCNRDVGVTAILGCILIYPPRGKILMNLALRLQVLITQMKSISNWKQEIIL